tara:strand:+ start:1040 stop:1426 length:387 start_codon:yes stop_codon:yes gene_type:complete
MYYFAYGTNLNCRIFQKKFKNAIKIRKHTLKNFRLVFQTKYKVPDIHFSKRDNVKGIIYKIDKEIEKKLDKYEDYPSLYIKKYFYLRNKKIMYYSIRVKTPLTKPHKYYLKVILEGYKINNFNKKKLL